MSSSAPPAHRSVLADPAVAYLVTNPDGCYVDGTFGRGGHARRILQQLSPRGQLVALDRDPQAAVTAAAIQDARFHFAHTPFSRLSATLMALQITHVHGVLLDLGVSSPQIDEPHRGFSLRADAPLDMRMDTSCGPTAADWLSSATFEELARVIRGYGEERFAASIAKAIVARRAAGRPIASTGELAALVADTIPAWRRKDTAQHPATRTFQAVRIHINQELEELALVLEQIMSLLVEGGRLVVISFHSLEDRLVKRFIDAHAHPERPLARLPLRQSELPQPRLSVLAKVLPDPAEIAVNPRARSAVMRVAQRTAVPLPHGAGA